MPCLVTVYPAPATINDEIVEILKVFFPSPPVPHKSIEFNSSKSILRHRSNNASLNPSISSTQGILILYTVKNEAINESSYFFAEISNKTDFDSSYVRVSFSKSFSNKFFIMY